MFCELRASRRLLRPALFSTGVGLLLTLLGCGHKGPPVPPPLRHPAVTKDLVVQQRGDEILLSFSYPQTTVSGTPLEPLQAVEYWEVVKPVPTWVAPSPEPVDEEGEVGGETDAEDPSQQPDLFGQASGAGDDLSRPDPSAEPADDADKEPTGGTPAAAEESEPALTAPPPTPPTQEELLAIDLPTFAATAVLRTTLSGDAIDAATFGDRIVLSLDVGESIPPPMRQAEQPVAETEATPHDVASALEVGSIFAIKTAVGPKLTSGFSNIVAIAHRRTPDSPSGFELDPGPERIVIRWPASENDVLGYHVYRRDAQSPFYGSPLAFVPVQEVDPAVAAGEPPQGQSERAGSAIRDLVFSDASPVIGQRYIYALTAVSNRAPIVESAITTEREVDYADRFPPTPPDNLLALAESGRVRLLWDASPENDVIGYVVLRRERDGAFNRLHADPVVDLEFSDRAARAGQAYGYRIIAVDRAGNESDPSDIVEVRAP
ncbi:MAG: fibronectin type III domain-containing protein [Acidobacteriota bacterium]|nr:fibronectin type III domain-containing protein [Acidobacteriota bacterium]